MRLFILLFFLLNGSYFVFGQLVIDKIYHNFDAIYDSESSYTDFIIQNTSDKNAYILRAQVDEEVIIKYSSKTIAPGESEFMRVKYVAKSKGHFDKKILLYVSTQNQPYTFKISGTAHYIEKNNSPDCPDFSNKKPIQTPKPLDVTIEVVDKASKKAIENAKVSLHFITFYTEEEFTGKNGKVYFDNLVPGSYYFIATAKNYQTERKDANINIENNSLRFELEKLEAEKEEIYTTNQPLQEKNPSFTEEEEPTSFVFSDTVLTEMSETLYKPNNIVFLIDASNSMNQRNRLDLLKISMIELLKPLRVVDKLSIITYASSTNVILSGVICSRKEEIAEVIFELQAEGLTAAEKGLDEAYELAHSHFIQDGNNEIIIATDGAFNVGGNQQSLIPKVKKEAKKNIHLSVLGIKNGYVYEEGLKELAKNGNGDFVKISNETEANETLLKTIKAHSLK